MNTPASADCIDCAVLRGSVFGECPTAALTEIAGDKQVRSYPAGSTLFVEGAQVSAVYCVSVGEVTLRKRASGGRDYDVATLGPGPLLGFRAANGQGTYQVTAIASSDVTLCSIPIREIEHLIKTYPAILLRLVQSFCNRIEQVEERLTLSIPHTDT